MDVFNYFKVSQRSVFKRLNDETPIPENYPTFLRIVYEIHRRHLSHSAVLIESNEPKPTEWK